MVNTPQDDLDKKGNLGEKQEIVPFSEAELQKNKVAAKNLAEEKTSAKSKQENQANTLKGSLSDDVTYPLISSSEGSDVFDQLYAKDIEKAQKELTLHK
jgi:hypothetical protein